jgi:phage gp36-like protein
MSYATTDELLDRIGVDAVAAVADRAADGSMDDEAVSGALDDAGQEIDSYLVQRYVLPLASIPGALKRVCIDMAMYHLSGNRTTEEVEKRYKNAIAWLRDISRGLAGLGEHPAEASGASSGAATFSAGARLSTRDSLKDGF